MNCERYQETMSDTLASGESELNAEIAAHLRTCGECREFYEVQRRLLAAIDEGVRGMVNEPVPASLLPVACERMEEAPARRKAWQPGWPIAVAATLILAIGFAAMRHNWEQKDTLTEPAAVPAPDTFAVVVTPDDSGGGQHVEQKKQVATGKAVTPNPVPSAQTAEVIVLPDEREAFARFVSRLPEEREAAAGLARPAAQEEKERAEIALLQIKELEVDPLERSEAK
jgi:predicted anti-sigma-YlaC factor YlaD